MIWECLEEQHVIRITIYLDLPARHSVRNSEKEKIKKIQDKESNAIQYKISISEKIEQETKEEVVEDWGNIWKYIREYSCLRRNTEKSRKKKEQQAIVNRWNRPIEVKERRHYIWNG